MLEIQSFENEKLIVTEMYLSLEKIPLWVEVSTMTQLLLFSDKMSVGGYAAVISVAFPSVSAYRHFSYTHACSLVPYSRLIASF